VHQGLEVRQYLVMAQPGRRQHALHTSAYERAVRWPLHDIVTTNIIWCIAYIREVEGRFVSCPIVVQTYCNGVGNAGRGGGNIRMMNSCTEALKCNIIL